MNRSFFAVLALIVALVAGSSAPARAEDSSCNQCASGSTQEFAAQSRPRITIYPRQAYPGRNAKRQCRAWLAKEYRVSGPVVVPRQQCWWE
jgi:hypothetical protein